MNKHIIHGRLTRDPEFVEDRADEKKNRAKFTVAVDRSYGDEADFFDCIVWGKRAAVVNKWFSKGKEIVIEGEGRTGSYTDKNGVKHKTYTINVGDFDFCGSRGSSSAPAQAPAQTELPDTFEQADEDVPF